MKNPESHRIIAVSRDLEAKGFKMNKTVVVSNAGDMNGLWVIRDRMNKRWTKRIDFLVDETLKGGKWTNVKIKLYEYNITKVKHLMKTNVFNIADKVKAFQKPKRDIRSKNKRVIG